MITILMAISLQVEQKLRSSPASGIHLKQQLCYFDCYPFIFILDWLGFQMPHQKLDHVQSVNINYVVYVKKPV